MNEKEKEDFHHRLSTLFSKYESILTNPEQLDILKKGVAFSSVNYEADILIMGMNPSLRTNFLSEDGYSYRYESQTTDMYFKKFHTLLAPFSEYRISYIDLFYQKHSEQAQLKYFLKDEKGRRFLKEQLKFTSSQIIRTQPKLILLFNKKGAIFFQEEWMPITLRPNINIDISELRMATIYDSISAQSCQFLIYFSTYLGYRTSNEAREKVQQDIPKIFNYLSKSDKY